MNDKSCRVYNRPGALLWNDRTAVCYHNRTTKLDILPPLGHTPGVPCHEEVRGLCWHAATIVSIEQGHPPELCTGFINGGGRWGSGKCFQYANTQPVEYQKSSAPLNTDGRPLLASTHWYTGQYRGPYWPVRWPVPWPLLGSMQSHTGQYRCRYWKVGSRALCSTHVLTAQ